MKRGPIVTNADRDWAISQCPDWMSRRQYRNQLPEVVDDGRWLDVQADAEGEGDDAPSAFNFVLEQLEAFEKYFAGQTKTEAQWSYFWRQKWWPKARPEQRYPKSAPMVDHPFWRIGTPEFQRALDVATDGERKIWRLAGFAQMRATDERVTYVVGGADA